MILFSVEGGGKKGYGHLIRVSILATELTKKGFDISFICTDKEAVHYLNRNGIPYVYFTELEYLIPKILSFNPDILISDQKNTLSFEEVEELRYKGIVVIEFDRANGESWADEVVNGFESFVYGAHGKPFTMVGHKYFIVHPEFAAARLAKDQRSWHVNPTLFISFGGSDPANLLEQTLPVLSDILDYNKADIYIVGFGFDKQAIVNNFNKLTHFNVFPNADSKLIAQLMSISNLAIISFGTLLIEALTLGLPIFMINPTKAHEDYAKKVLRTIFKGVGMTFGYPPYVDWDSFSMALKSLRQHPETLQSMENATKGLIDGKGVDRVAEYICSLSRSAAVKGNICRKKGGGI